jgi:hypothetical protein
MRGNNKQGEESACGLGKIFANHIFDKVLIFRMHRDFLKLKSKQKIEDT